MNKSAISLIIFAIFVLVIPQSAFAGKFSVSYYDSDWGVYYSNYQPAYYRPIAYPPVYGDIVYPAYNYGAYPSAYYYPSNYYNSNYRYPSNYYNYNYVPGYSRYYNTSPYYNSVGPSIAPTAAFGTVRIEKQ